MAGWSQLCHFTCCYVSTESSGGGEQGATDNSWKELQKQSPMQRSSPALFHSCSFSPSKKRSLLRREANVGDDNDDTRELLLAACRDGECHHRHHHYNNSNTINNNINTQSHRGGMGDGRIDLNRELTNTDMRNHHPHHQYQQQQPHLHYDLHSNQKQQDAQQRQRQQHQTTTPQRNKRQQDQMSHPKDFSTLRQSSAPTPMSPIPTSTAHGTVQQQHSFPEWTRTPDILPLFPNANTRLPTRSSPSSVNTTTTSTAAPAPLCDNARHPPTHVANILDHPGCEGHVQSNGNSQISPTSVVGGGSGGGGGWVIAPPKPSYVNVNPNPARAPDDEVDSQGRSFTPDTPSRSGEEEEDREGDDDEEDIDDEDEEVEEEEEDGDDDDEAIAVDADLDFGGNNRSVQQGHSRWATPPSSRSRSPGGLPSFSPAHHSRLSPTDTSPSDLADESLRHPGHAGIGRGSGLEGRLGRQAGSSGGGGGVDADGGGGNSTSAGGVSLSDDASILSLSDPSLHKSSPCSDHAPPLPLLRQLSHRDSQASGDPDLDPDLDLSLSHSLSIYHTADSRASSSEALAVPNLSPDPYPHSQVSSHPLQQLGSSLNGGAGDTSPCGGPDSLVFPDASG